MVIINETQLENENFSFSLNNCPCCGAPLERFTQPGYGNVPDRDYEHCVASMCSLYMVTLSAGDHANLTRQQIDDYGKTRARHAQQRTQSLLRTWDQLNRGGQL